MELSLLNIAITDIVGLNSNGLLRKSLIKEANHVWWSESQRPCTTHPDCNMSWSAWYLENWDEPLASARFKIQL
jgi:hypothetical protein